MLLDLDAHSFKEIIGTWVMQINGVGCSQNRSQPTRRSLDKPVTEGTWIYQQRGLSPEELHGWADLGLSTALCCRKSTVCTA